MIKYILVMCNIAIVMMISSCSYMTEKFALLVPDIGDSSSITSFRYDERSDNDGEIGQFDSCADSSVSGDKNNSDNELDCLEILPVKLGNSFVFSKEYSDIKGTINYTINEVKVFENLYQAGFTISQIGYPKEYVFPYVGSPKFEEIFSPETGEFKNNIGIMSVSITVSNVDAYNTTAEADFGDKYLFDIRKLYLADFKQLNYSADNFLRCAYPMAFSGLNSEIAGPYWYHLQVGEETNFQIGYIVDLNSFDNETCFLCGYSGFRVPDEIEKIMFVGLK